MNPIGERYQCVREVILPNTPYRSSSSSSSSSMALQSRADLHLLKGLLPVNSVFFLPHFPVLNFAPINICLYTVPPSVFGCRRRRSRLPWRLLLNA